MAAGKLQVCALLPPKETLRVMGSRPVTSSQAWGEGMRTPLGTGRNAESTGPRQSSPKMLRYWRSHNRVSRCREDERSFLRGTRSTPAGDL